MAYLAKRSISISDPRATDLLSDTYQSSNRVSRKSIFQIPSLLHAVRLTSSAIARTDCNVYRELRAGGRDIDYNHPAQELLTYKANPYQSSFIFIQSLIANALISDGFSLVERDDISNPLSLHLLDSNNVYPVQEFQNGRLTNSYYGINSNNGQIAIAADDILHIRNLSYGTGLCGVDLVRDSNVALSRAHSVQQFSSRYFDNSSHIDRFLKIPGWLNPEQSEQLRDSINSVHRGVSNVGKLAILQGGSELGSLPLSADQLTESQETTITDMGNLIGTVSSKLGARNSISYGSLSEDNRAYLSDTLDYWLTQLEAELNCKLLRYREKRFIEFDRESLFTSDPDYADSLIRQFQGKALSWEEMRSKLKRTTDTKEMTFGNVPGQEPVAPVAPPIEQPQPEPEDTKEESSDMVERASQVSLSALKRIKKRIVKSIKANPDLSKHYEIIRSAFPDDSQTIIDQLDKYQDELNYSLPEQRESILQKWNIEQTNNSIWR